MEWSKLKAIEKARVIKLALDNGVSDINTIRDTYNIYSKGGEIHIDPSKRGTFTAAAKKHGMGVQEFASRVLANKENYSPAMVKKAVFAHNSSKWHKHDGSSDTQYLNPVGSFLPNIEQASQQTIQHNLGLDTPEYQRRAQEAIRKVQQQRIAEQNARQLATNEIATVVTPNGVQRVYNPSAGYLQNVFQPEDIPFAGDAVQAAEAVGATIKGDYKQAAMLAGLLAIPSILEKPFRKVGKKTLDFSDSGFDKDILKDLETKQYQEYLRTGKLWENSLTPIPSEHLGTPMKGIPDNIKAEFENSVFPRMINNRPWLNKEDFIRKANARLGNEYFIYPGETIDRVYPSKKVEGVYYPSTDRVIARIGKESALSHEFRHKLDNGIELTDEELSLLEKAFGKDFINMQGMETSSMFDEMVTTNLDARNKLLGDVHTQKASVYQQNKIIDKKTDEQIVEALSKSNGYGKKLIAILKESNQLTPDRIQAFREAMKKVGVVSIPLAVGVSSINADNNKYSTGGPLYPFSFRQIPAVRYKGGGFISKIFGKQESKPVESIMPTRQQIVDISWQNENPTNRGLQPDGTYIPYEDPNGRGMDVGPGLLLGEAIPIKDRYTREELDEYAYRYGLVSLDSISNSYNTTFGTQSYPTPFDTVSVQPKLLMMDTRYQNGSLPASGWPSLYKAISEGNWAEAIRQTRSTFKDKKGVKHYDNDRVRRRAETIFPNMFDVFFKKDSSELPVVTKKKGT